MDALELLKKYAMAEVGKKIAAQIEGERLVYYARFPVQRHISKKNNRPIYKNRKTGRTFLGKNKDLSQAEAYMVQQLRLQGNEIGVHEPIRSDLHAVFWFVCDNYYTKKGTRSQLIGDLSNLIQLPEDCLQAAGIIENDSQICSLDGSRRLEGMNNEIIVMLFSFKDKGLI